MNRFGFKDRFVNLRAAGAAILLSSALAASAGEAPNGFRYSNLAPKQGLKPFEYMDAPAPMPNYIPGAKWGTIGEPIRTMQKPLSPDTIEDSAAEALSAEAAAWAPIAMPVALPAAPAHALEPAPRKASAGRFAKNVALFFAAPFITLAWVVVGPIALLGMLAWTGVKSIRTASKEGPR